MSDPEHSHHHGAHHHPPQDPQDRHPEHHPHHHPGRSHWTRHRVAWIILLFLAFLAMASYVMLFGGELFGG